MKALDEVGLKKATRFFFYSLVLVFYHLLIDHLFYIPPARNIFLKVLGAKVGEESVIMNISFFNWHNTGPKGLQIGKKCFLGDQVLIDLYDEVALQDEVTLGQRVMILTHTNVGYQDHPLQKKFPKTSAKVVIRSGSFIGAGSIILPGVTIGNNSFIAAGSVVNKDVPPNSLYAGVPAKLIKRI